MSRRKKRMILISVIIIITITFISGLIWFKSYEKRLIQVAQEYLQNEYFQEVKFERVTYNWIVDPAQHMVFFSAVNNSEHVLFVSINHNFTISRTQPITVFKGKLQ